MSANLVTNITENWNIHPIFSRYEISDLGRVRRLDGRLMKVSLHHTGYLHLKLDKCAKLVHVLVLEAFVGQRPRGQWTRHLNGVRSDNRLINLCWGTASQNYADSIGHGTAARHEKHPRAKLSKEQVYEIRLRYFGSNTTQRALAKEYGLNHSTIQSLLENRTWQGM